MEIQTHAFSSRIGPTLALEQKSYTKVQKGVRFFSMGFQDMDEKKIPNE